MTTDDKKLMIRDENYKIVLTQKQKKFQFYHQPKSTNMNILQVKRFCLLVKNSDRTS